MPSRAYVLRGLRASMSTACVILCFSFFGFGAYARDAGFALWHVAMFGFTVWALPSAVVFVTAMASGASLWAAALAVTLSAVRLLPMTVALTPLLRQEPVKRIWFFVASHFVAVTGYVEALLRLPKVPAERRLSFFLGLGTGLMTSATCAGLVGHIVAGSMPPPVAAGLVFLTPLYFLLSMFNASASLAEKLALAFGFVLGPIAHRFDPEFDLLYAGLAGGTLGYLVHRLRRRGSDA